jgi:hypothetical protein
VRTPSAIYDALPNDTLPFANPAREYALPSCGACLRIAHRKGWNVGDLMPQGEVEAFVHSTDGVVALCHDDKGFIVPVVIR